MKKSPIILMVSLLAFTTAGCGLFGGGGTEQAEESPQPEASPPASPSPSPQTFGQSAQPGTTSTDIAALGLIPSTNPNQRRQEIQKGRDNPFGIIPIQPVIKQTQPEIPLVSAVTNSGSSKTSNTPSKPPSACLQTTTSFVAPPIPNEARSVLVLGIVQLPGIPVAIVKAPDENVERQVTPGSTLASGQVLVKAIYSQASPPVVVLEQYGIAVPRTVGQAPESPVETPPLPTNPDGFGKVNNLVLLNVELGGENAENPIVNGTMCNDGQKTLVVSQLRFNILDKQNSRIINSMAVELASPYVLAPGQKAEFDGRVGTQDKAQKSELGLRGRNKNDVIIKLVGWS